MTSSSVLKCPDVGHKTFSRSLRNITLGEADTPQQLTKFIRPYSCVVDALNANYEPGELQKFDLSIALATFAHGRFVAATFEQHRSLFRHSLCWVYQFQTFQSDTPFVFGTFITDGQRNLLDYCVETALAHKRRQVLHSLMRAICTHESVARRLDH